MALIVYNKENSRPQEVTYKGKRTINLDSRGTVYLSKMMSIELGVLGGGRVSFAHDDETGDWYICRTTDDGEGGAEKRTVHDGEDTHGGERNGLLQDTALESDFKIGCT